MAGDVVNVSASSDYGASLRRFHETALAAVTRKTTVIVLGDGRGNYRPHEAWVLEELHRRAKHVLWLSPEDRGTWGFGDSDMRTYLKHVDAVHVVRNLHELGKAVMTIL